MTSTTNKRPSDRPNFSKRKQSSPDTVHELVFAVQQRNLQHLEQVLIDRSSPGGPLYQQWLTFDEVGDIIANDDGARKTADWLTDHGAEIVWISQRKEFIKAQATVAVWNELLNAEFSELEDTSAFSSASATNDVHRTQQFSLPAHIHPHVSAVLNAVQIPPEVHRHRRRTVNAVTTDSNGTVTVALLNSLYDIPPSSDGYGQQQAIFETGNAYYSPTDLTQFQEMYDLPVRAALHPHGYAISSCAHKNCYEGNLDVQYIMGVAQHTEAIYWYTEDGVSSDPFVDWILAMVNVTNPPLSNFISWGAPEQTLSADLIEAFNTEAMKLAVMGVTVIVSSGDNGASGGATHCALNSSGAHSSWKGAPWTGEGYFPSFPATSPYVTAVGATMGPENGLQEVACQSQLGGVITSGGGFSTYYPQPSWQTAAVAQYFASLPTDQQPTDGYNPQGRAYPDVSLIGVKYQTVVDGQLESLYGTAAAAPVFAAMVSLLNAERAAKNMSSLGFLNPTLYAHGVRNGSTSDQAFVYPYNDVVFGHNKCTVYDGTNPRDAVCCESGFHATEGWDPVSGFGSINYPTFRSAFDHHLNITAPQGGHHRGTVEIRRDEWIAIYVIVSVIGAWVAYTILSYLFCKKPALAVGEPIRAVLAAPVNVVTAELVAVPTTARYRRVREPVVIQLDSEYLQVDGEVLDV